MKIETRYRYARRDIRKLKAQLAKNTQWLDTIANAADDERYLTAKSIRDAARSNSQLLRSIR